MKRTFNLWLLTLGVITFTFWSCKKQNQQNPNQDGTSVADKTFRDVFTKLTVKSLGESNSFLNTPKTASAVNPPQTSTPCAGTSTSMTLTDGTWPKIVTHDFGNGCTKSDGIFRSGKLTIVFSGPSTTTYSSLTARYDNYIEDDGTALGGATFNGIIVITNIGYDAKTKKYTFTTVSPYFTLVNPAIGLNIARLEFNNVATMTEDELSDNSAHTEWNLNL